MKKIIDYTSSIIIIFLGTAHTALTPVLAKKFNSSPEDFAAIGLVFVFLGFINLSRIKANLNFINILCLISNLIGIGWLCLGFIYSESFIQGILPAILLCILLILSVFDIRKAGKIS